MARSSGCDLQRLGFGIGAVWISFRDRKAERRKFEQVWSLERKDRISTMEKFL